MLDPDAPGGTFTHWLVYRIPPGITSLAAMPPGAAEGVNDFGRRGYEGPCPPRAAAHHYHFVVLALDTPLGLPAGARRSDLDARISGHVLGSGELIATYRRLNRSFPASANPVRPAAARSQSCSGADHRVHSTSPWQTRV
jgi:Raf kinase inhibitor-like YbhB/YbcL family protein